MRKPFGLLMVIAVIIAALVVVNPAFASIDRDVNAALKAADSLSRAKGVTGAVRARSFKTLGDYQFVKEDYKKAFDFYRQALAYDTSAIYRQLYEVTSKMTVNTLPAPVIIPVPAIVSPPIPDQLTAPPPAPASQPQIPVNSQQPPSTIFTIQVGAFGSKENADNMVTRLTGKYEDITISPTTAGDQTLYRVRVGSFPTRESAVAFADKMLTEAGMSARVVEK
jgi:cell division septation protein DedD